MVQGKVIMVLGFVMNLDSKMSSSHDAKGADYMKEFAQTVEKVIEELCATDERFQHEQIIPVTLDLVTAATETPTPHIGMDTEDLPELFEWYEFPNEYGGNDGDDEDE